VVDAEARVINLDLDLVIVGKGCEWVAERNSEFSAALKILNRAGDGSRSDLE
jgi:hypothetical protein